MLHPQLPLLVFLMAAVAKGYTLGRTLASACLRIVHDLAVVPVQDSSRAGAPSLLAHNSSACLPAPCMIKAVLLDCMTELLWALDLPAAYEMVSSPAGDR